MRDSMPRQLSQFDFHHTLADHAGSAVVVFSNPGCGACRHLLRVLAGMPELTVYTVDAQRDPGLVREFEVFHLPALFLYRDGVFHCQLHSPAEPARIRAAMHAALALPAEEAP